MGESITEQLRTAAQGLILADAQKHILAHRLVRKLRNIEPADITVSQLLTLIESSMWDMTTGVEVLEISEDAYRDSRVATRR